MILFFFFCYVLCTTSDAARHNGPGGLNTQSLGEFLGSGEDEFMNAVRRCYAESFDISGIIKGHSHSNRSHRTGGKESESDKSSSSGSKSSRSPGSRWVLSLLFTLCSIISIKN